MRDNYPANQIVGLSKVFPCLRDTSFPWKLRFIILSDHFMPKILRKHIRMRQNCSSFVICLLYIARVSFQREVRVGLMICLLGSLSCLPVLFPDHTLELGHPNEQLVFAKQLLISLSKLPKYFNLNCWAFGHQSKYRYLSPQALSWSKDKKKTSVFLMLIVTPKSFGNSLKYSTTISAKRNFLETRLRDLKNLVPDLLFQNVVVLRV